MQATQTSEDRGGGRMKGVGPRGIYVPRRGPPVKILHVDPPRPAPPGQRDLIDMGHLRYLNLILLV